MARPSIGMLDFGRASAEKEGLENPRLLVEGFLDLWRVRETLLTGNRFLVLGYKGSGKSAIGEHLRIRAQSNPTEFVRRVDLSDLPFGLFPSEGSSTDPTIVSATWRFALMLEVFESFLEDEGSTLAAGEAVRAASKSLRDSGLLPSRGLPVAVRTSRKSDLKLSIPGVGGYSNVSETTLATNAATAGSALVEIAARFESGSTHTVVVDGLDDMFVETPHQLMVLAGLVNEADRINSRMSAAGVPVRVVLLCRTDIFERLPSPNKNKLRQDAAIELAWYKNHTRANDSKLFRLATMKARVSDPETVDVIAERLPSSVATASNRRKKATHTYLIERTRHLPRDLLRLLTSIQRIDPEKFNATSDVVRAATSHYSATYLLPESKDDLSGFFSESVISELFTLLGRMRRQSFRIGDEQWKSAMVGIGSAEDDLVACLAQLYEVGSIGVMQAASGGNPFYSFRYRNPHASFDAGAKLAIHKGLHSALNIPSF